MRDLDWGSIHYLCDESITLLYFAEHESSNGGPRSLKIYGSPMTPQYSRSAFQRSRDIDVWSRRVPLDTDILLTHGPPYKHLDGHNYGCRNLAREVERTCPRLVVFGHIHVGYGQEEICFDGIRKAYEKIRAGEGGWSTIAELTLRMLCSWLLPKPLRATVSETTLINASVVSGVHHGRMDAPFVVTI